MRPTSITGRGLAAGVLGLSILTVGADALAQSVARSRDAGNMWQSVPASPLGTAAAPFTTPSFTGSSFGIPTTTSAPPLLGSSQSGFVPSWNSQPNAWRIGVAIENTDSGVVLTDVERNMPADRAGLVRGDSIINIEGFQIGYIDGSLFDLGDELQRRTDATGKVDVLAFDSRNRRVKPLILQLIQQSSGGVSGEIQCRERITLSPQAVLTVRLRDVTYPNWQNVSVGEQVIPNPPHPPIPFSIQVDPAAFYPDHRYALDAFLVDRGQIVLQSSAPTPVDPRGSAAPLQVTLVRTSASTPPSNVYAVGQLQQIAQWYRQYLGREATPQELAAWQSHLQAGRSPQDILAYLLGSSEYYDRLGNRSDVYLNQVYQVLNGRQPTAADLQQFAARYDQYGGARSQFVRDMLRFTTGVQ